MLKPGRTVSDYEVNDEVGAGGIATVYRVVDRRNGAVRALKVLHVQTPTIRERLEFEGQIQSALRHPNIVPVYDVLNVDGWPALVMEYVDGPSLQKWLSTHRVKVSTAERLFRGIVDAVALAHDHGLVHRDLKPANILLQTENGQLVPKVTDFGLARLVLEDQDFSLRSRSGIAIGTPGYMALEQLTDPNHVDQRADIFALGCILYELLTGKRAYDGPDVLAIFNRVALGRYIPPQELTDGLPTHLVNAVVGCLHPLRDQRIADCTRLRAVLDGALLAIPTPPVDPADADVPRPAFHPVEAAPPVADEDEDTAILADEDADEPASPPPIPFPRAPLALVPSVPLPPDPTSDLDDAFADHEAAGPALASARLAELDPVHTTDEFPGLEHDEPLDALPGDDEEEEDRGSDAPMRASVRVGPIRNDTAEPASVDPVSAGPAEVSVGPAMPGPSIALAARRVQTDPTPDRLGESGTFSLEEPLVGTAKTDPIRLEDVRKSVGENTRDITPRAGSGLPLPAGASAGAGIPDVGPPASVDPRDARAAIGRLRDQMQPRQARGSLLPFVGVLAVTVLAATSGLLWWDHQNAVSGTTEAIQATVGKPARPKTPAPPVDDGVSMEPTPSALPTTSAPTLPAAEESPAGAPVAAPLEPAPTSRAASATPVPAPVAPRATPASTQAAVTPVAAEKAPAATPATAEKTPASGGAASIRIDSDATENFLVPTDPSTSISRHGKGSHAVSTKAGAYTVVARFAEGESPFFLDLNVSAGASCDVTCRASTHTCTASGRCGTR